MFLELAGSNQGCDDVKALPHNVDHRKITGHIERYLLSLILIGLAYDIPLCAIEIGQIFDTIPADHLFCIPIR